MVQKKQYTRVSQPSAFEFFERFPSEQAAREYLESARWPAGIRCNHCGHDEVYKIREGKIYTCKVCRKQFSIRTGTIMEDSHISLRKWLYAMYLVSVARKGISSIQLAKELGITQKSAWFMLGRIRESCRMEGHLSGVVEADETYIGGKEKNKHASNKHLRRYIDEFIFRLSTKDLPAFDATGQTCGINFMRLLVVGMIGRRLTYRRLTR